jgi:ring-1,2-phenylacetyl-CoA epoxidase subunit PaaE
MSAFHNLRVADVRRETSDCVSVSFDVPEELREAFAFKAGAYLTLQADIDGESVRRSYSLCTAPEDAEWRVAIKEVPSGRFSTFANRTLAVGDLLEVMPPAGRFLLEAQPSAQRNLVAIAAGSGITPILAQIRHILSSEPLSTFTLLFVNRETASIIFKEAINELKDVHLERFRVFHLLTQEPVDVELFSGRLDAKRLGRIIDAGLLDPAGIDGAFLCGPQEMVEGCSSALEQAGTPKDRIHFELFTVAAPAGREAPQVASAPASTTGDSSTVQIVLDGITTSVKLDGKTAVLDAALDAGLDVPYSCQGGVCCTCRAKMTQGKASMEINYSLEPKEVEQGFILTCQAHVVGDGPFVVDYDQQ